MREGTETSGRKAHAERRPRMAVWAVENDELIAEIDALRVRAERAEAELERIHRTQDQTPWSSADSHRGVVCPYHDLIDNLEALVLFIDRDFTIRHANRYALELSGRERAELEGVDVRDVLGEVVAPAAEREEVIERLLRDPAGVRSDEIEVMRPDGTEACLALARRPVHDASGVLLGVVVVGTDISARREVERQRADYQEALRSLTSVLALTQERERRSIAARIHDEISQNLAYAKLRVNSLNGCSQGKACDVAIGEINDLLDNAIAGTRALSFELSPPLLHELGFVEAAEWLTEQFGESHDIGCEFTDDGREKRLSPDLSVTLFRAVDELLDNVARHADANRAEVSISRGEGRIEVRVSDDGRGFDPSKAMAAHHPGDGFGLFNIRERLDYFGGTMEIESDALTGTRVTLRAPLNGPCS